MVIKIRRDLKAGFLALVLTAIVVFGLGSAANAVTCGSGTNNWTGSAGDNQWATATNWSTGAVPVSTDNVCVASTFTSTITIGTLVAANQTIKSLTSGAPLSDTAGPLTVSGTATFAADLHFSNGTLTLNGTSSMTTLEHSAGTLNGTGTLTVSGLLSWSGGTEGGTGVTDANGGMNISGEPFLDTRTINNSKTATWTGIAFLMLNGSIFNNQSSATWNHQADSLFAFEGGTTSPTINNAGTFEKTAGTNSSGGGVGTGIVFNNTGKVLANSGTLVISDAGSCTTACAGTWTVASGDTLMLGSGGTSALSGGISGAGTVNFSTGTVNYTGTYNVTGPMIGGGGTVSFISPATVTTGPITLNSGSLSLQTGKTITTTTLTQTAGTLTGGDTVTITGMLTWSGGTQSGTGITNANGGMTLSGEPFLDTRTMNNAKTANWTGIAFLMLNGSIFNNQSGATWNHQADSLLAFEGGTKPPTFNNAGTFEKTSGTTASGGGVGTGIVFNNTGAVEADSGILVISDAGSCATICAGTWSVTSGNTLELGSGGAAALNGKISGAGTVNFNTGTVNYSGTYDITGLMIVNGGMVSFISPAAVTTGPITLNNGLLSFQTGKTITTATLTHSAGTLTGSDTVTITGMLTWSGGTQSGTGITNANGGMTLSGEPFLDTRTMNNAKTANWTGIAFLMLNGSIFNNKAGATWNHEGDTQIAFEGGTTAPTFNNAGTFEKTTGTSTSGGGVGSGITFSNSGTVIAKSGILLLGSNYTQTKGSTLLEGGTISMSGSSPLTEQAGSVQGSGTITGDVTNTAGLVSPSLTSPKVTTGTLNVNGSGLGNYSQGAGGSVLFNIGGTGAGQMDVLNVSGTATLAGTATLCLVNGFKPTFGTTFPVMTYASETGSFSKVQFGWSMSQGATTATATYHGAPNDEFSPATLAFPSQQINTTSAAMTEKLTNVGQVALTISGIALGGANSADFQITSNTCGSALGVGATCTLTLTFKPSALGKRNASITVTDDACGSPHVIPITGSGTEITMSPSPVNFGTQTVGTTSAPMTVTLTNHGTTTVTVKSATISGTNKADFKITNNTCTTLAASGTCTISVTFTPAAAGSRTGTLSVTDTDKGSPQTDVLEGTGSASE